MKFTRFCSLVLALTLVLGMLPVLPAHAASGLVDLGDWSEEEGNDYFQLEDSEEDAEGLFQAYSVDCDSFWDAVDEQEAYAEYLAEEYGYTIEPVISTFIFGDGFFNCRWLSNGEEGFDFQYDDVVDVEDAQVLLLLEGNSGQGIKACAMYGQDILSGGSGSSSGGGLKFTDPESWDKDFFLTYGNPEDFGDYYRQDYVTAMKSTDSVQEIIQKYVLDLDMVWSGSYKADKYGYFWLTDTKHDYETFSYEPTDVDIEIEDCHLIIGYRKVKGASYFDAFCLYSKDLAGDSSSAKTSTDKKAGSTQKQTQPTTVPASNYSGKLPDLQAFSGNRLKDVTFELGDTYSKAVYCSNGGTKFVKEYISLLVSEYGFTLRGSDDSRYYLDYNGSGVSSFNYDSKYADEEYKNNIELMIYDFGGSVEVQIWYADGLDYTDTGDRTELEFSVYGGGSSSGGSSYKGVPCSSCNNGRCRTCDGDGYVDDSDGLGVSACGNCNAGSCRSCGGDGYR